VHTDDADTRALALVARAQSGDEDARREVALYVYDKYVHRIRDLYSVDPAVCEDDIKTTFFEAIFDAVMRLDERGNPIYHAGQRGVWACRSLVRSLNREMRRRALPQRDGADLAWDELPGAEIVDEAAEDFVLRVECEAEARERVVRMFAAAPLRPRVREAAEAIIAGRAGDPRDLGFNQRLAAALDVSEQRASQVVSQLRVAMEAAA
jgi:hypothetical protein